MSDQPTQICDNCLKSFPESKIATHFGYCRRNIKRCQTCGEMYDINFKQDHDEEFHKLTPCKHCKKQFKPHEVNKHEQNCTSRTQFCQYCELNVPIKDYPIHLKACEARTKNCQKCRKPISNKEYLVHMISCPGYVQEPKPRIQQPRNYDDFIQRVRRQQNPIRKQKEQVPIQKQYKPTYPSYQPQQFKQPKRQINPTGYPGYRELEKKKEPVYEHIQYKQYKQQTNNNNNRLSRDQRDRQFVDNKGSNKDVFTKPRTGEPTQPIQPTQNYRRVVQTKETYSKPETKIIQPNMRPDIRPEIKPKQVSNKMIPEQKINTRISSNSNNQNLRNNGRIPAAYYDKNPSINEVNPRGGYVHSNKDTTNNIKNIQFNNKPEVSYQPLSKINERQRQKGYEYGKKQTKEVLPPNFTKKQVSTKQPVRRQYNVFQHLDKYNEFQVPSDYNYRNQRKQYKSPINHTNYNYHETNYNPITPLEQDEQIQRAIQQSMKNNKSSMNNKGAGRTQDSKKSYKIDEIPAEFLMDDDMMNQSFYDKQMALMEEFNRNKKR